MNEHSRWQVALGILPQFSPRFKLDSDSTALMLIDMQKGYLSPSGGLVDYLQNNHPALATYYLDRVKHLVIPNQIRLLEFFRRHNMPIIYITFASHLPNAADWLPLRRARDEEIEAEHGKKTAVLHLGDDEANIISDLAPRPGELVINKVSRGAFNSTGIEALLRNMGITGLVIGGVITNVCVETTARDAADRGFKVVLVDDACASYTTAADDATMHLFNSIFGQVMDTHEIIENLDQLIEIDEK